MMFTSNAKLPFPADKIVSEFANNICQIEPHWIDGIYLTGSITLNDFYSNKSDIDFLVLCKKFPESNTITQLKKIHHSILRRYNKPDLSGCYLTTESMSIENPESINVLSYHEGALRSTNFEMAPVSFAELKSNSITVFGKDAATLSFSSDIGSLNNFLYHNINSYWKNWITAYSNILRKKILLFLFPRLTEWSVLGVARQLYTLQTGKIVSKTDAGYYCLQHVPVEFHSIIQQAIEIRKDNRTYPLVKSYAIKPSVMRMQQTIECVNYIITFFNQTYNAKYK
jgi:Aminoglycoside adenylyltransferase, C-terminal domain/Nucleotidyltransferase domain